MTPKDESDLRAAQHKRRAALIERIGTIADMACDKPLQGELGDIAYDLLREAAAQIASDRKRLATPPSDHIASPSGEELAQKLQTLNDEATAGPWRTGDYGRHDQLWGGEKTAIAQFFATGPRKAVKGNGRSTMATLGPNDIADRRLICELRNMLPEIIAALATTPHQSREWPADAEFQFGQRVTTPRKPFWEGVICGWYLNSEGRLGFNVEATAIPLAIHNYPQSGLRLASTEAPVSSPVVGEE